jgi:membrane-associated protein
MTYPKFILYNIVGAISWVALMVYTGFYFGNIEVVKNHFSIVILTIIFISILPGIIEYIRHKRNSVET